MTDIPAFVPASKLTSFFSYIRERGVDSGKMIDRIESDPAAWRDPATSISLDVWLALNREASRELRDPDFGLGFGMYFWGMPTMLGHLLGACGTIGDSLDAFIRYQGIEHHSWRFSRSDTGSLVEVSFEAAHPLSNDRLIIDFVLANLVGQTRRLTGDDVDAVKVNFAYPRPASVASHEKIFRCPMEFGSTRSSIAVTASCLSMPVRTASEAVKAQLAEPLERALRADQAERTVSGKVTESIARRRGGKSVDAASVADELGMGIRDLQLKLKAEGTTFHDLREAFLSRMAIEYLRDGTLGLKEIAFLLGFSEPSAFHRAFVRWTGRTPGEMRGTPAALRGAAAEGGAS